MKGLWKIICGWGGYPKVQACVYTPESIAEVQHIVLTEPNVLAQGSGCSYGDSSLYATLISTRNLTRIVNQGDDWIEAEAGATIGQLLQQLFPNNRFLSITPGTKAVTIGGAIASDVHGKNHVSAGSFFNITESLQLVNEEGKLLQCSRHENADLFYECFGTMGLRGIIVSAVVRTSPLPAPEIVERQFIVYSVAELLAFMQQHHTAPYLVSWLDLLNTSFRGIVKTGEWNEAADMQAYPPSKVITIPFRFPFAPPTFLFRWYNKRYLAKARQKPVHSVPMNSFFYPLDAIVNWRYAFGRKGLLQYHFRLPPEVAESGMMEIVQLVSRSKAICTLAVLKRFGKGNPETPYSFAKEGYNLALDFIHNWKAIQLVHQLDEKVMLLGGHVYKAKDAFSRLPRPLASQKFQSMQNQRYAQPE